MGLPKLSIVTISYNAERFIERTIQSVLEQDYQNLEYIIVDGASRDGTLDIVNKYKSDIDKLLSEPDSNLYEAMNKGLDLATGDYVVFLNSGDKFASESSVSAIFQESGNADFMYANAVRVDESGNRQPWHKQTPQPDKLNAKSFINGMVICHQCMLVKRDIVPKYRPEKWKISCDLDWSIRVLQKAKTIHYLDETFVHYLEGGISNVGKWQAVKERFSICRIHFGLLPTLVQQFKILWKLTID